MSEAPSYPVSGPGDPACVPPAPATSFDPRVFARLARLELSENEVERYAREFRNLLAAFRGIADAPVAGLEPMVVPIVQPHRMRPDTVCACDATADVLRNAPGGGADPYYRVPKVKDP